MRFSWIFEQGSLPRLCYRLWERFLSSDPVIVRGCPREAHLLPDQTPAREGRTLHHSHRALVFGVWVHFVPVRRARGLSIFSSLANDHCHTHHHACPHDHAFTHHHAFPSLTNTPSVTDTATITPTPFIPPVIEVFFESEVTPNPNAIFSELQFTTDCSDFNNFTAGTVFQNPITYMCAVFTYDQMTPGAQWTALWYRDGKLVHYETIPWDGETGGFGFTEWEAPASEWLPGTYEVQIFVGLEWKQIGQFVVEGDAPTAIPTMTPSLTRTPTKTLTPTSTGTVTHTPTATRTPIPTLTPLPTNTP